MRYRAALARKAPPDAEMALLPLLANTGCFLDIGANLGTWSFRAAKYFQKVHAFEPNEELAALLRKTLPCNVSVHAIALSDHEGNAAFSIPLVRGEELTTRGSLEPGANVGYSEVARQVPIMTLDKLHLQDVRVIKIDVEGHERATIDGAAETITQQRPVLIVEIEERHHPGQSVGVFDQLLRLNYECWFIRHNRLERFKSNRILELQPPDAVFHIGMKSENYVANFIFIPSEQTNLSDAVKRRFGA